MGCFGITHTIFIITRELQILKKRGITWPIIVNFRKNECPSLSTDLPDINSPGTLSPAVPLHYLDGTQDLPHDVRPVQA
jgi:hypothetical protein